MPTTVLVMAETRPMPPVGDLIALTQASLRNAVGLVEDARLLLSSGSASRAHALATLALEEVGKSCLCMLALVPTPASMTQYGLKSGEDFWAAWREHTDKLMWALGVLDLLIRGSGSATQAFERIRAAASDGHPRKLRGLYVDYDGHNVLEPGAITDAEAEQVISDAQIVIDVLGTSWLAEGSQERATENLSMYGNDLTALFEQAKQAIQVDADGALAQFRQFFNEAWQLDSPADPTSAEGPASN